MLLIFFVAKSAQADQAPQRVAQGGTIDTSIGTRDKCAFRQYVVCVNDAYHRLRNHGDMKRYDKERQKCDAEIYRVIAVVRAWQKSCEGKRYTLRCHHPPTDKAVKATRAEFLGCVNTVNQPHEGRIARMDAAFAERRRLAEAKLRQTERDKNLAEARQRFENYIYHLEPVRAEDVKKAEPVAKAEAAEDDGTSAYEAADELDAHDATKPPVKKTARGGPVVHASTTGRPKPSEPYVHGKSDIDAERYRQWRLRYPEVAGKSYNKPAYKSSSAGKSNARINCVPEHVSIAKVYDNGDAELFIGKGADIYALQRCMPNHDWDAERTIKANIAAATIPYYMEFANKPMNRNKLHFNQDRWRLKRADWKKPGGQFFADWLKKHEGKEIGFALQGGQRLKLLAKSGDESTDSKPVEAVKHGKTGYYRPSDSKSQLGKYAKASQGVAHHSIARCASAHEPCARRVRAGNKFARAVPSSLSENEIRPTGRACGNSGASTYRGCIYEIKPAGRADRAGKRSNKISHLESDNVPRDMPQTNLWHRGRHGPYAFG
ncbi:hypothetical protein GF391_01470 [Candidatus Uhrbacteria bacterium]|nr:hypothetical protein [Candidatus Uhrbacteria bacterium]